MAKHAATVDRLESRTFLALAFDGPLSAAARDRELDGHLQFVEKHCDRYLCCGPIRSPDGEGLAGSFFLLSASDAADARRFLDGDPYLSCGMYEKIVVHEVTVAAGRWMGGVIWESADEIRGKAVQAGDVQGER